MIGKEITFVPDVSLKIISYNAKKQQIYFKYKQLISSSQCEAFLEFDKDKVLECFENLEFKYSIGEVICDQNRELLVIDRFKYMMKKLYKVKCIKCGYEAVIDEYVLKKHLYSCGCCYGNVVVKGVNDIPTTNAWMIPYFQGGKEEAELYTFGSNAKLYFKCPSCKRIKKTSTSIYALFNNRSIGCDCSDNISYPEKFIRNILSELNIDYVYQLSKENFEWIGNYRYDFYIPSINCIIEANGEQHYTNTFLDKPIKNQNEIDEFKEKLAKKNGVTKYLTIDCRKSEAKYIFDNLVESGLFELLNINPLEINIELIDSKSLNNIIKEVCEYYQNNNKTIPSEIAEVFKLDYTTICKYLHKGNSLGWCNYNPKQNLKNGAYKSVLIKMEQRNKTYGKVVVFKNNIKVGTFESQRGAYKYLCSIGENISVSSIGQALKRENRTTKGYQFYYENELKGGDFNESKY